MILWPSEFMEVECVFHTHRSLKGGVHEICNGQAAKNKPSITQ